MSSSTEIGSLSELAYKALGIQLLLGQDSQMTAENWEKLRGLINELQSQCPNHQGILAARVRWMELALDSFEVKVVAVAEGGDPLTDPKWLSAFEHFGDGAEINGLVTHRYMIEQFIRRHYLKEDFPRLYERWVGMLDRLLALPHLNEKFRSAIGNIVAGWRQRLLEGRL